MLAGGRCLASIVFASAISFWLGAIAQDSFTIYQSGIPSEFGDCLCKVQGYSSMSPLFPIIVFIAILGIGWFMRGWFSESNGDDLNGKND